MCESIVVVGAALSADVDAPTERVHSAPGARRGQSPKQPTGERAGRENTEEFRVGSHGDSGNSPVSSCLRPTARRILARGRAEFHHGLLSLERAASTLIRDKVVTRAFKKAFPSDAEQRLRRLGRRIPPDNAERDLLLVGPPGRQSTLPPETGRNTSLPQ